MKSLILMGFAACVVASMTWTVDAKQLCENEDCRHNGECRPTINNNALEAHCVLEEEIHENYLGCINAKPLLQYQRGDGYHLRRCGESNPCPDDFYCSLDTTASFPDHVCCPDHPAALSKTGSSQRIVGGTPARYGDHPYICSLRIPWGTYYYHVCGCIIWNNYYVVTAAHCLEEPASFYRVLVGKHGFLSVDSYEVVHTISSCVIHPNFTYSVTENLPNDIAVLKMELPITFTSHVNKATFAKFDRYFPESCMLIGWGYISGEGFTPDELQVVNMTKISNRECADRWSLRRILDGQVCFYEGTGTSSCRGDSGGPVVCGQQITGIHSWGQAGCYGKYPSVKTRVSYYYQWLVSIAGSN